MSSPQQDTPHTGSIEDSKLWKVLNSGIVLWFLSTVLISVGSVLYANWTESRLLELQTDESIRKLDLEVANRLSFFAEQISVAVEVEEALLILEDPRKSDFPAGVFPEYYDRSLYALLWELHSLVPQEEKGELKKVLESARDFKKVYLRTVDYSDQVDEFLSTPFDEKTSGKTAERTAPIPAPLERPDVTSQDRKSPIAHLAAPTEPISINLNVSIEYEIKFQLQEQVKVILFSFEPFNLERWDKPFQAIIENIKAKSTLIESSSGVDVGKSERDTP